MLAINKYKNQLITYAMRAALQLLRTRPRSRGETRAVYIAALTAVAMLTGCKATPVKFQVDDSLTAREAASAIDRSLMSQPPQFRPESVDVTDEYVVYGKGTVSNGKNSLLIIPIGNSLAIGGGRSRTTSKNLIERIYFDTFSEARVFAKRRLFIVNVYSNDRQPAKRFYLYNEVQARALVNALQSLKRSKSSLHSAVE